VVGQSLSQPSPAAATTTEKSENARSPDAADIAAGLAAHDRALLVKTGWIRDPYIVIGPDKQYYLTGTTMLPKDRRERTDRFNAGLGKSSNVGWRARVWRSPDLVHWESLGAPYTLKDGVWFAERRRQFDETPESDWRLWAPELHFTGKCWALVHTSPEPVDAANLSLTEGPELKAPWTNPLGTTIERRHDPSLFRDDDGTWWMVWGATQIAPLKPDFSGFAAPSTPIGPSGEFSKMGHEGCLIRKIGGKYVLFGTAWSTGQMRRGSYNLYYAVADKVTGPYGPRQFVGRFLGHGTPFQDHAGRWWCTAFYNANVPPIDGEGIEERDLRDDAYTINRQGVTLVPLAVSTSAAGEPIIRAIDPRYASPGPDERQRFELTAADTSPDRSRASDR
jgi:arylsulfatase